MSDGSITGLQASTLLAAADLLRKASRERFMDFGADDQQAVGFWNAASYIDPGDGDALCLGRRAPVGEDPPDRSP